MLPRVVIIGSGFGGLWAAKTLAAGLSPADIAAPIRGIVGAYRNITVVLGSVASVDVAARTVLIERGRSVPYDHLILATGARHAYFGHDDWEPFARLTVSGGGAGPPAPRR